MRSTCQTALCSISMVTLLSCSGRSSEGFCETASANGYRSVVQEDITREYIVLTPDSYDGSTPLPVVINFHGSGGCADDFAEMEADLTSLANNNDFLLVYPQGVLDAEGLPEWRPVADSSQSIQDNDFIFVERIIEDIGNEFNVNSERIYAIGLSNGGMMAYGLACRRANLIAAVGVMAGTMLTDTCNQDDYTSVIHFHGTEDTIVPLEGSQDFPSVTGSIQYWVTHNNISTEATIDSLDNGTVTRAVYDGGAEDSSVALYTIQNGYHVWFDDNIDGQSPNQILWDFLSQYTLSGRTDSGS